jgi:hypothetical protein
MPEGTELMKSPCTCGRFPLLCDWCAERWKAAATKSSPDPDLEFSFAPPKRKPKIPVIDLSNREHTTEGTTCWCDYKSEYLPESDMWHVIHDYPEQGDN